MSRRTGLEIFLITFGIWLATPARAQTRPEEEAPASSFGRFGSPSEVSVPSEPEGPPQQAPAPWHVVREPRLPRFGDAGELVILSGSSVGLSSRSFENSSASAFSVVLEPAIEYFVTRDISVGLELDLSHSSNRGYGADGSLVETDHTLVGGGAHFGVNIPLTRLVSLYPLLAIGVHRVEQTETLVQGQSLSIAASPTGSAEITRTGPWLSLQVPLVLHVAPHFFVGLGPIIYHDFSRAQGGPDIGAERTNIGGTLLFGGYFGSPPPSPEDAPRPDSARFGDRGTVVLTEESALSWRSTSYSGSDAAFTSFSLSPGFDWFFTRSLSFGAAVSYTSASGVGIEPGDEIRYDTSSLGALARFGVAVPLASWASLYPRLSLAYSVSSSTESGLGSINSFKAHTLTGSLFAPALAHLASHLFVGFGPWVARDLVRTITSSLRQNQSTAYGLGTLVGGWL